MDVTDDAITLRGDFGPEEIIEEHVIAWRTIGSNLELAAQRMAYKSTRSRKLALGLVLIVGGVVWYSTLGVGFTPLLILTVGLFLFAYSFIAPSVDPKRLEGNSLRLRLSIISMLLADTDRLKWFVGERTTTLDDNGAGSSLGWQSQFVEWTAVRALYESERSLAVDSPAGYWLLPKRWCGSPDEVNRIRTVIESSTGLEFQSVTTERLVSDITPLAIKAFEKASESAGTDHR